MMAGYDYGRAGCVGIGTPQANPTVEAELSLLLPPNVMMCTTRLTSRAEKPADRLRDYLLRLEDYMACFDTLKLDVFGFACTASSYLVPQDDERRIVDGCSERFHTQIVTAADAIAETLERMGATRVAFLSPYPPHLSAAAHTYWTNRGLTIVDMACASDLTDMSDTRGIYCLGSDRGMAALDKLSLNGIDAVLMSGTGMPSLPLIAQANIGLPVLSSNLCLASSIARRLNLADPIEAGSAAESAWRERCFAAIQPIEGTL